ncbi:MAG: cbb3-type cytochrome c oxidase subunit II [Desulfurivibrionaceae bacterium]|nr:cbb3-type cytochrome c oxidase subunit II [Desulfurivibrionaceae bacterium]
MWDKNPVVFLVLATLAILVGTVITMVLPFATVNTGSDRIETVTPYNALQLSGRDVYVREGCNNCHTQTVRPLVAEVLRYGDYSKSGEFVYDQPHLWGSRRTGPDLARIGEKYPDAWHFKHMRNPQEMIPKSNMPAYAFLDNRKIDPAYAERKMQVLGFPYSGEEIASLADMTEMDAMVAYLQKLGSDIPWRQASTEMVGELKNPNPGDPAAVKAGRELYVSNCQVCHGADLEGDIAAELTEIAFNDAVLFQLIHDGIDDAMPGFASLGAARIWQLVNYLNYGVKGEIAPESEAPLEKPEEELRNPTPGDLQAIEEGREYYLKNCRACHGENLEGGIGPALTDLDYGDAELFNFISAGVEGGMPAFTSLGTKKLWQIVNYLNYGAGQ